MEEAWSTIAQCFVDDEVRGVAHLPSQLGGMGFTRYTRILDAAFDASSRTAMGDCRISQRDRVLQVNRGFANVLREKDSRLAHHLDECQLPGASAWLKSAHGSNYIDDQSFSAAMRFGLWSYAPRGLSNAACPGCNYSGADMRDWMAHVSSCARLHGYNASTRHAAIKKIIQALCNWCGVPYDHKEPRFKTSSCPGCNTVFSSDQIIAHVRQCRDIEASKRQSCSPHRSGPDMTLYFDDGTMTVDFTVIGTTCPSYAGKTTESLFKARRQVKFNKYENAVTADGHTFVVVAVTALGHLSKDSTRFIEKIARAGGITTREAKLPFQQAAAVATGRCVLNAEREAGMWPTHTSTLPTISATTSPSTDPPTPPRLPVTPTLLLAATAPPSIAHRASATVEEPLETVPPAAPTSSASPEAARPSSASSRCTEDRDVVAFDASRVRNSTSVPKSSHTVSFSPEVAATTLSEVRALLSEVRVSQEMLSRSMSTRTDMTAASQPHTSLSIPRSSITSLPESGQIAPVQSTRGSPIHATIEMPNSPTTAPSSAPHLRPLHAGLLSSTVDSVITMNHSPVAPEESESMQQRARSETAGNERDVGITSAKRVDLAWTGGLTLGCGTVLYQHWGFFCAAAGTARGAASGFLQTVALQYKFFFIVRNTLFPWLLSLFSPLSDTYSEVLAEVSSFAAYLMCCYFFVFSCKRLTRAIFSFFFSSTS